MEMTELSLYILLFVLLLAVWVVAMLDVTDMSGIFRWKVWSKTREKKYDTAIDENTESPEIPIPIRLERNDRKIYRCSELSDPDIIARLIKNNADCDYSILPVIMRDLELGYAGTDKIDPGAPLSLLREERGIYARLNVFYNGRNLGRLPVGDSVIIDSLLNGSEIVGIHMLNGIPYFYQGSSCFDIVLIHRRSGQPHIKAGTLSDSFMRIEGARPYVLAQN